MSNNIYIQNEAKKGFKGWTKEGIGFLLEHDDYKDIAITNLSKLLDRGNTVEFKSNDFYYEIFASADSGYVVNVYSSNERDEDGEYLEKNIVDGGLCTGSAKDAIEYMM